MPGHIPWYPLPVEAGDVPSLLVSAEFEAQSYTVRITDLANVWTESIDKRALIMRALKEDTSIDPTEGPDQIRKLLDLLRAAFDSSAPEHDDTSMVLSRGGEPGSDSLALQITVILPQGLRPLKWPLHLKKLPGSAITTELVLPLVHAAQARARERAELMSLLRDKDTVIGKLLDKLEAMGMGGLEHVFTSLSGLRKASRAAAADRIRGLAPFREADFRKRSAEESTDVPSLLGSVFGSGLSLDRGGVGLDDDAAIALNDWWTKLGRGQKIVLASRGKSNGGAKSSREDTKAIPSKMENRIGQGSMDEDEFQVQATPPGVSSRKHGTEDGPVPAGADDTSDGEDVVEDSMPGPERHSKPAPVPAKPSGSRLGAIGKNGGKIKRPSPVPEPTGDDGSETASDVDSLPAARSPSPPPPPKEQARAKERGGGLGRIGGKAKAAEVQPEETKNETIDTTPRKSRGRLGAIGKKAEAETATVEDIERPSRTEVKEESQQPRETSLDRANRKRAELQMDLERRAAGGGPAKKKRKF
jgi:hypothetical protein